MSTYYRGVKPLPISDIKTLNKDTDRIYEVEEYDDDGKMSLPNENKICLTDGDGEYLWCYGYGENVDTDFVRYGNNNVEYMIEWLSERFEIEIIDEWDSRW
jgi:hypothetical protein